MSFQLPLGLLGLIGVPILIIIYIIKSKFTEQTVSATYLWTLSERFLKKKRKDNKLTGIISLILQILAVIIISLTIAQPVFTIPGAANDYYFILDSTGSMNIVCEDGETRFNKGKAQIREIILDSMDGSTYTLVRVSGDTNTLFKNEGDKESALKLLDEIEPGYGDEDYYDALTEAQSFIRESKGAVTYLITDKSYTGADNVEIINVQSDSQNYGLSDLIQEHAVNGDLTVNGMVASYKGDARLKIEFSIDGEKVSEQEIDVVKNTPKSFTFEANVESYGYVTVKILAEDSLATDNEVTLYNVKSENAYKTLLVSDTPFFLQTVLKVVGNADITVMSTDDYKKNESKKDKSIEGFGLYVFHSCNPESVPDDGSVWLINTTASIENSGFNYQGEIKLDKAESLEKTASSASVVKKLLANVKGEEIYISKYSKYDTYRNFNTLFTHNGNPLIFTGMNMYGNREVVFAFDLHNSDMPLLTDYVLLVKNLLDYSFPAVIEKTDYICGENALVNVVSNCESIRVESPSGKISHLALTSASTEFLLDEVGTYVIKATINGAVKEFHVYSSLAKEEQVPVVNVDERISLSKDSGKSGLDGIYDKLIVFFICLVVIISADWVVYCYDKYQLR